jgi:hypothetical protein
MVRKIYSDSIFRDPWKNVTFRGPPSWGVDRARRLLLVARGCLGSVWDAWGARGSP